MANPITFADLDRLLTSHGFVRNPHPPKFVAYTHPLNENYLFVFPDHELSDPAGANHVFDVRRHFDWWGFVDSEEWDRWVCRVRFGAECVETQREQEHAAPAAAR